MLTEPISLQEFNGLVREDGYLGGYHIDPEMDERKFSDVLSQWVGKYENKVEFIKNIGLSGNITKDDLDNLLKETKIPSRNLTNYLSTKVPSDVCNRIKIINRGKDSLLKKGNKEQVTISDEAIQKETSRVIKDIVSSKNNPKDNSDFVEWLSENINEVAARYKKPVNNEKIIEAVANILDISVDQLKGVSKMDPKLIQEKAEALAALLHEGEDFDFTVAKATSAWSEANITIPAYSQMIRHIRHSTGMTQREFSVAAGVSRMTINGLENGISIEKNGVNAAIFKNFKLSEEDKKIISDSYEDYKNIVIKNFTKQSAPIIERFSKYGLTKESYLGAAIKEPRLFWKKSSAIISNIETVQKHFKKNGLTLENYLKAALNHEGLFYQNPQTIINNIEGVYNQFKDGGLTLENYLKAAVRQPQLFSQKSETIKNNVMGVYNHFKGDGLELKDYLKAAVSQPQLFYQDPKTIIDHIDLIIDMYRKELFNYYPQDSKLDKTKQMQADRSDITPVFKYISRNPAILTFSTGNIKSRYIASALDKYTSGEIPSTKNLFATKAEIMDKLLSYFNEEDTGKETPANFVRAELLKPRKPIETKALKKETNWVTQIKKPTAPEIFSPAP